ncbi:MAG: bifunctional acetate--CoA ligase family protein/GNAT family N-acetyltransferase [Burkholderiales bacterium]|nr:bifunctional acetate--CoA ligase family protein/GNAT family N-acetyltransferase [Burkholderiales bacterium]
MHSLDALFSPESVALIGASEREGSVGRLVLSNLIESHFKGNLYAVNPKREEVLGIRAYPDINSIEGLVQMAVIVTPAPSIPELIDSCGKKGVRIVVIITAGMDSIQSEQIAARAKSWGIRIVGPNCLGVMRPSKGLNATFSKAAAKPGNLALVSQSGALCTAILDWAKATDVGFSSVISMGDALDTDFGEILDFLLADPETSSILIYVEGIRSARRFISALRAAARTKPVLVLKVGRNEIGSKAALTHTGSIVGKDAVFSAALRRAGTVRVKTYSQLFAAAKILSAPNRPKGDRLAIVTNGGGPGVMAADSASDCNIALASLSDETLRKLDDILPHNWSHGNPVDLIGDATTERFEKGVEICMEDPNVDTVLVMLTPQAMTEPEKVADAMIKVSKRQKKMMLMCWMGEASVASSRRAFDLEKMPSFRSPETAVESFSYLANYHRNQQLLLQVPGPLSEQTAPDVEGARTLIEAALAEKRHVLNEIESKALLAAFRIPISQTFVARTPSEALLLAVEIGFPLAMKIHSPDISHKSDSGGVRLNISNAKEVANAYREIVESVTKARPDARIEGISIQPMLSRPNRREVMVGVTTDPVFGPVISFGAGGTSVEALGDVALALPPLNHHLIEDLISRTRISAMLGQFRAMPPIDRVALEHVLLRISEMICELPWLREMDINPLIIDDIGAIAVDARIIIDYPASSEPYEHMAIYPYPTRLEREWLLSDGTIVTIRPIRPEDAEAEQNFVKNLSEQTRYMRFFTPISELTPQMLSRFTQIDYDREMAFIAMTTEKGREIEVGVARYIVDATGELCEFAIVIADDWQHKGLGAKLMFYLMESAKEKGVKRMEGDVLSANTPMLDLMTALGFSSKSTPELSVRRIAKDL